MKQIKILLVFIILYSMISVTACGKTGATQAGSKPEGKDFPNQTIHWVVPVKPGGGYDTMVRGIAPSLAETMGVPVVIENFDRTEGYNYIYKAKPDGYTISIADPVGEFATKLLLKPVYDIEKYTWLGRLNSTENVILASPKAGFNSTESFLQYKQPIRFGVFGFSVTTVQGVVALESLKMPYTLVKFAGPAEMSTGLLRGDADLGVLGISSSQEQIKAGNVIPIVVLSDKNDPRLPEVKTLKDIGIPEVASLTAHRGVAAPPGVPDNLKKKLIDGLERALQTNAAKEFFSKQKYETNSLWGDDFLKVLENMKTTVRKYEPILQKVTQGL